MRLAIADILYVLVGLNSLSRVTHTSGWTPVDRQVSDGIRPSRLTGTRGNTLDLEKLRDGEDCSAVLRTNLIFRTDS